MRKIRNIEEKSMYEWNRRPSLIQIDITEKEEKLKGCYILMW